MNVNPDGFDPIGAVALLEEPNRRRLYDLVSRSQAPIGRDEAATVLGISRELAAFHLDRLAGAGLLSTEFRRRGARTGPGAGRPAKLYRRASGEVAVSLPPRAYDVAAEVMATAFDRLAGTSAVEAVTSVARERGRAAGRDARRRAGRRAGRTRLRAGLIDVLRGEGYEPDVDPADGTVVLRNCPFDSLVAHHRELTCNMNLAWAEGVLGALGEAGATAELAPEPGRCCVLVHPARPGDTGSADGGTETAAAV
jgi:predicted ArsR family transcriptional regulator